MSQRQFPVLDNLLAPVGFRIANREETVDVVECFRLAWEKLAEVTLLACLRIRQHECLWDPDSPGRGGFTFDQLSSRFFHAPTWCLIGAAKSSEGMCGRVKECEGRIPTEPHE